MPRKEPRVFGDIVILPLTKGYYAAIDLEDFDKVQDYNWCADVKLNKKGEIRTVYATRAKRKANGSFTTEYLHTFLLPSPMRFQVDHKDSNGLNNLRDNLRVCTPSENNSNKRLSPTANTSGVKGVSFYKAYKKWQVQIWKEGVKRCGYFDTLEEAKRAYASWSKELHGDFSRAS